MFRTVLMLAAVLTLAPAAFAGSPELPAVEKKVKAKKLDKLLLGEWRIYPASDPELSKWLSGMSSLDMSIDEIAAMYRLSDRLKGRLELERAKKPPALPPQRKTTPALETFCDVPPCKGCRIDSEALTWHNCFYTPRGGAGAHLATPLPGPAAAPLSGPGTPASPKKCAV